MDDFGKSSSVKVLAWLTQYKKLSTRASTSLSEAEGKLLKELELKLGAFLSRDKDEFIKRQMDQRQKLRVDTEYHVSFGTVGEFQKAYIRNISGGGVFIETENIAPMGSQVKLELRLPDEIEPLKITTEVSWTNPKRLSTTPVGMGVRFLDLKDSQRIKIQRLININLEKLLLKKKQSESPKKS